MNCFSLSTLTSRLMPDHTNVPALVKADCIAILHLILRFLLLSPYSNSVWSNTRLLLAV